MKMKRILITALVSIVAAGMICVVLVGMIDGVWPWSKDVLGADYTGMRPGETTEDTTVAEDTTTVDTSEETTETTGSSTDNTAVSGEKDKNTRPTEDKKLPVDVIVGEPTESTTEDDSGADADHTKPTDKIGITMDELLGNNHDTEE